MEGNLSTFNEILNKTIIYALTAFQKSKHNFVYYVQFIDNEIPSCIRHITLTRVTLAVLFDKTKTVNAHAQFQLQCYKCCANRTQPWCSEDHCFQLHEGTKDVSCHLRLLQRSERSPGQFPWFGAMESRYFSQTVAQIITITNL